MNQLNLARALMLTPMSTLRLLAAYLGALSATEMPTAQVLIERIVRRL
jgi:hypothetical protein